MMGTAVLKEHRSSKLEDAYTPSFWMSPSLIPIIVIVIESLLIACSGTMAGWWTSATDMIFITNLQYQVTCILFVISLYLLIGVRSGLFHFKTMMRPLRRADDVFVNIFTSILFFLSIAFAMEANSKYSLKWLLQFFITSSIAIVAFRLLAVRVLTKLSQQKLVGRTIVVLGCGEQGRRFLQRLQDTRPYFSEVVGVFRGEGEHWDEPEFAGHPLLGGVEDLVNAIRRQRIDDVVIAMPWSADRELARTVERLKEFPVNVYLSTDLIGFELAFRPALGAFQELPMFEVVQRPISGLSSLLKTLEDYILASFLVLLLSPLLVALAVVIKLDSPGPVLFRQRRLGFNNKVFSIYKFRSMYHQPAEDGSQVRQATRGDPRVTRIGRFIRATSLDELPQLFNVLDGTMSLVGPRPHAVSHNEEYGARIRGYFARHNVKPGITGWAQVNGLRGETDTIEKMRERIRHDVYYTENWSVVFDIRILFLTIFVFLFQKSAY